MSVLQKLKIVVAEYPNQLPEIVGRRNTLIKHLHDQLEYAKAKQAGQRYVPTTLKTVKTEEGERIDVEQPYRVRPWSYVNDAGKMVLVLRYGNKKLELAKGKHGIEVENLESLIETLSMIKQAVADGELDDVLNAAAKPFARKIAK